MLRAFRTLPRCSSKLVTPRLGLLRGAKVSSGSSITSALLRQCQTVAQRVFQNAPTLAQVRYFSYTHALDASPSQETPSKSAYSKRENEVIRHLCTITSHGASADIVASGLLYSVRERQGMVSIEIELDPNFRTLRKEIETKLTAALGAEKGGWIQSVRVSMASSTNKKELASFNQSASSSSSSTKPKLSTTYTRPGAVGPRGLSKVRNVIAVSSGKGGVGKSTVAVNLAYALSQLYRPATEDEIQEADATAMNAAHNASSTLGIPLAVAKYADSTSFISSSPSSSSSSSSSPSSSSSSSSSSSPSSSSSSSSPSSSSSSSSSSSPSSAPSSPAPPPMQVPLKVGVLDADIYGPSLPTMVSPTSLTVREFKTPDGDSLIEPLVYEGVKLMSYGFIPSSRVNAQQQQQQDGNTNSGGAGATGAAIMRGPLVSQLVNELATRTHWDDLDYLVIDMPPGTGDIQLTLTQNVKITGAVIVTTPQKLSFVDVVKGIDMFDQTKVPIIGVVENMAYFTCPSTNHKHYIFGDSTKYIKKLRDAFGVDLFFQVPIVPQIASASDSGDPFVLTATASASSTSSSSSSSTTTMTSGDKASSTTGAVDTRCDAQSQSDAMSTSSSSSSSSAHDYSSLKQQTRDVYRAVADAVVAACVPSAKLAMNMTPFTSKYIAETNEIAVFDHRSSSASSSSSSPSPTTSSLSSPSSTASSSTASAPTAAAAVRIPARTVRLACKCAACVHETTGRPLLRPERVPMDVKPTTMTPRGQYALSVTWSDGHLSSMYPWEQLLQLGANTTATATATATTATTTSTTATKR